VDDILFSLSVYASPQPAVVSDRSALILYLQRVRVIEERERDRSKCYRFNDRT